MQNGPDPAPRVSIVMPHWQVRELVTLCLRSIRKYTREPLDPSYEVIVVDNGSKDESLDYLRGLSWIRLIERGDETPDDWIIAMATALDIGIREARGEYLCIMHTDVIIKKEGWLGKLVSAIESDPNHAAAGMDKLDLVSPVEAFLKKAFDTKRFRLWLRRTFTRDPSARQPKHPFCPRDYCALYRVELLRKYNLSFIPRGLSAGETMYLDLVERGHTAAMLPVREMARYMDHIAHGTASVKPGERALRHRRTQRRSERRAARLFNQPHVRQLQSDTALDQG